MTSPSTQPPSAQTSGLFHGWWIVATVFLGQGVATGLTTYSFGLFQVPLAEEFGVSRSIVSLGMTGHMLLGALLSPLVGRELDRRPIRSIMLAAGACMALAYWAMSAAPSLWLLGALFVTGSAIGMAGIGPLPASKLVATWFFRGRGRALGVSAVGTSAGGLVAPPLLAAAIASWGWRGALAASGLAIAVVALPPIALAIRNRPADLGLHPDGAAAPPPAPPAPPEGGWSFARLARDRNFWVITAVMGTIFGVVSSLIMNLPPIAAELGIDAARAAGLISFLSVAGIAGKLLFGAIADRVDKRVLLWLGMAMLAGFLLITLSGPGFALLAVGGGVMGFALGGALPLWGALIGDCYGSESFGAVMGWMAPLMLPFNIAGIQFLPWCYDTLGSYTPALRVYLGALAVAAALLLLLRLRAAQTSAAPAFSTGRST